jgi:hypothetical protein
VLVVGDGGHGVGTKETALLGNYLYVVGLGLDPSLTNEGYAVLEVGHEYVS